MRCRIFATSSALNTLYQGIYARHSRQPGDCDILLIDGLWLQDSQRQLIRQAAGIHDFAAIHDFSKAKTEGSGYAPGWRKRWTRHLKTRPGFKQLYDALYGIKQRRENHLWRDKVLTSLSGLPAGASVSALHMQPVLHLNAGLRLAFPGAAVHFFEHGMGDYMDIGQQLRPGDRFHCVFDEGLRQWRSRHGLDPGPVQAALPPEGFEKAAKDFPRLFPQLQQAAALIPPGRPLALILGQPLEQMQVDPAWWDRFMELCLDAAGSPAPLFLLKPHPMQSAETLLRMQQALARRGAEMVVLDNPLLRSLNVEVLFSLIETRTVLVASPFSSALYYLSKLYPEAPAVFASALAAMMPFTARTPDLYLKRWAAFQEQAAVIFGERVRELES